MPAGSLLSSKLWGAARPSKEMRSVYEMEHVDTENTEGCIPFQVCSLLYSLGVMLMQFRKALEK